MIDTTAIKQAASGRWPELLHRLTGIPSDILDGRNHPCPKCGGVDRFRMIDADDGALFCNKCFQKGNGDGIAAVMWLTGQTFAEALHTIAAELGIGEMAERAPVDVIQEMAWRKGVTVASLKAFGATTAIRGQLTVCRVPMYDAGGVKVGDFDMAPSPEDFAKGKMTQGSKHGLFCTTKPEPGQQVLMVEGVKDAAALHALGYFAIGLPTCRMDAGFARFFRGCNVVIVPDRDKAGTEGAQHTAANLYGIAASVKVAELPAEYRETGGADVRDVLRTRDGETKVRDAIAHARDWMPANGRELRFVWLNDAVDQLIADLGTADELLQTRLPYLDKQLGGGVQRGEMVIIAGRPSHGKTVVAMQALEGLSLDVPTLMLSEEMPVKALAQRVLMGVTAFTPAAWQGHKEQLTRDAADHFGTRHVTLVCESCGTVERAVEAIERAVREHHVGAVCIDYVQLLRGKGGSRYEQISDVSTRLKQAAVRFNVVLLAVCQLNRQVETRKDEGPKLSDLRDSGQLEQDADIVLLVQWLHRTDAEKFGASEYQIVVAKNRNRPGAGEYVKCAFTAERQRLYKLAGRVDEGERYGEFDAWS